MATREEKERLVVEINDLYKQYLKLQEIASRDRQISEQEINDLSYYGAFLLRKQTELRIIIEQEKNPRLTKEQILFAIGKFVYESIVEKHKKIMAYFENIKAHPSFYDIYEWRMQVGQYKIKENELLGLMQVQTEFLYQQPKTKDALLLWAKHLKTKEKDFEKADIELKKLESVLRLEREAKSDIQSDIDAAQTADFKKMKDLFDNLLDRMQTTMLELNTHFVGWLRASEAVCLSHLAAEAKFKTLMEAQKKELGEIKAYEAIAKNIAITFAGLIFPGITTPFKTVVSKVISPSVDKKVKEYTTITAEIGGKVRAIKIGQEVTKEKADTYATAIDAIAKDLLKAGTLTLGINNTTKLSLAPAVGAHDKLVEQHHAIHQMVHTVSNNCLHVLNILQDWNDRLTRMNDDLFTDEHVNTSDIEQMIKQLYGKLSISVNTLRKAVKGLKPPSVSEAQKDKNPVYKAFVKVMLLEWAPGLRSSKIRTKIHKQPYQGVGMKVTYYEEPYNDYVPVIAGALQDAYKDFCGIEIKDVARAASIAVSFYDSWVGMEESDRAIEQLIRSAAQKYKAMENTDVWQTAMGI